MRKSKGRRREGRGEGGRRENGSAAVTGSHKVAQAGLELEFIL